MPLWRQLIAQGRVWSNEPTWAAQRASRDPSHSVVVSMFEPPPIRLLAWPLAVGWAARDVLLPPPASGRLQAWRATSKHAYRKRLRLQSVARRPWCCRNSTRIHGLFPRQIDRYICRLPVDAVYFTARRSSTPWKSRSPSTDATPHLVTCTRALTRQRFPIGRYMSIEPALRPIPRKVLCPPPSSHNQFCSSSWRF